MNTSEYNQKSLLPDASLIEALKDDIEILGVIHKKHKDYCLKFMRKQCNGKDYETSIEDIYQDATLVLYEKVKTGNFILTCSIQTYLNSICRNQLLNKFSADQKITSFNNEDTAYDNEEQQNKWVPGINDWLPQDDPGINGERVKAIEQGLNIMKADKGNCYKLLSMFYYQSKTMQKIAEYFEYANDQIAQNKAYRCREKLRTITFEIMKKLR